MEGDGMVTPGCGKRRPHRVPGSLCPALRGLAGVERSSQYNKHCKYDHPRGDGSDRRDGVYVRGAGDCR